MINEILQILDEITMFSYQWLFWELRILDKTDSHLLSSVARIEPFSMFMLQQIKRYKS